MKNIILKKINRNSLDKISISLFHYVESNRTSPNATIYSDQERARSKFYNCVDIDTKTFYKHPCLMLNNHYFINIYKQIKNNDF